MWSDAVMCIIIFETIYILCIGCRSMTTRLRPSFAGEKKILEKLDGYYRSKTELWPGFASCHKTLFCNSVNQINLDYNSWPIKTCFKMLVFGKKMY